MNRWILSACLLAATLAVAQLALRAGGEPAAEELVAWEAWGDVADLPRDDTILLEFSADWCAPCKRLQVTVFRDPRFVEALEKHALRPVRFEYDASRASEWRRLSERFDVEGYPAMVVILPDGRFAKPIVGVRTVDGYDSELAKRIAWLGNQLFFRDPADDPQVAPGRLALRQFDSWYYLPKDQRSDWRSNPAPAFSRWVTRHVDLFGEGFKNFPRGFDYYQRHGISTVPTLVLEDHLGNELARFAGKREIERAPAEIARIAQERGIDVPPPPTPFAALD